MQSEAIHNVHWWICGSDSRRFIEASNEENRTKGHHLVFASASVIGLAMRRCGAKIFEIRVSQILSI
jgi:hypothetical protein